MPGSAERPWGAAARWRLPGSAAPQRPPWPRVFDLAYGRSVFNSDFLAEEYAPFPAAIGHVAGPSAGLKLAAGNVVLTSEWSPALRPVDFEDAVGPRSIRPSAWSASTAWQFAGERSAAVGENSSFVAAGYSRSRGLAGVQVGADDGLEQAGALPRTRLLLTLGHWPREDLRLLVEYSRERDYAVGDGGSGRRVGGRVATLTWFW